MSPRLAQCRYHQCIIIIVVIIIVIIADVVVIAVIAVPYLGGHLVDDQNGQIVLVRQISQIRGEGRQGFGALYVIRRIGRGDRTKMKGDAIDDDQLDGQ